MKKKSGLFLLIALVAVLAVGCGEKEETKTNANTADIEAALKVAATEYYNQYQKGVIGQDYNEITLEMLENVNTNANAGYDLSKLKNCKKDTKVTIQADENRDIVDYKYDLNCN